MTTDNRSNFPNPFAETGGDPASLWRILVADDIEAFVSCDWEAHAKNIYEPSFFGINANGSADPSHWALEFPNLVNYRDIWLGLAKKSVAKSAPDRLRSAHFKASTLFDVQVREDVATCLKSFNNAFEHDDGSPEIMHWETQYMCRRIQGDWKIWSFVGFLPGRGKKPFIETGT